MMCSRENKVSAPAKVSVHSSHWHLSVLRVESAMVHQIDLDLFEGLPERD